MKFGIGQSVPRNEDPRFLTGRGRYAADIDLSGQAHAAFLYSPHARADIVGVDASAARAAPGVLAVYTGEEAAAAGLAGLPPGFMPEDMGGPKGYRTLRPILARDRVRHVGERVAMVVAETPAAAQDALELVEVEYEERTPVITARDAVADGAPPVHDEAPDNVSFTLNVGDAGAVAAAFERAREVVRVDVYNNRITSNTMEPRASVAYHRDGQTVLHASTQNPHGVRSTLARHVLNVPESAVRVVAGDVGGGFGMKTALTPEDSMVAWAARELGRPVKWVASRTEAMLADDQGRDQTVTGELAVDGDGRILAFRVRALHNVGAYISGSGCVPILFAIRNAPGAYDIAAVDIESRLVFSNTPPTTPYRGAGRPEATYLIERLMDEAARVLDMDRVEIRRRNFIAPEAMPYATPTQFVYDSGDFAATTDRCLALADWDGFAARRAASETAGRRRGIGIAYYIEDAGTFNDRMEIRFDPGGSVTVVSGTFSHGQGHETVYPQMVSDWLGVPFENIRLVQGDTAAVSFGRGTYASRSMVVGGSALRAAADGIIEKGKAFAAHLMEASPADVEFADGAFTVVGTDRSLDIADVAVASFRPAGLPIELGVGLEATGGFAPTQPSFPNGCHVCEVEVDPETGAVRLDRYAVVDDVGTVINPLLAHGQIHGGVVQGVGQALCEDMRYDPGDGQLLTGSFLDYTMPRADDVPDFDLEMNATFCRTNPIGAKGAGEGGTVGATPAVIGAILDALAPLGVTDIEMPATPERVWSAIRG